MKCFVAFNEADYLQVKSQKGVKAAWFGHGKYVPLTENVDDAVQKAVFTTDFTKTSTQAATEETEWYLLEMTFSTEQELASYKSGILRYAALGLRYFGDIQFDQIESASWLKGYFPAIGLDRWGRIMLATRDKDNFRTGGECCQCKATNVAVAASSKTSEAEWFCVSCWHAFHADMAYEGFICRR